MAHYAEVENGIVTRVLVVENSITDGQTFLAETLGLGGTWVQTSYNTYGGKHINGGTPLNMNYAAAGYTWDGIGFAEPQPYPSWTLDKTTYLWSAPIAKPTDNKTYIWDEPNKNWIELITPTV